MKKDKYQDEDLEFNSKPKIKLNSKKDKKLRNALRRNDFDYLMDLDEEDDY